MFNLSFYVKLFCFFNTYLAMVMSLFEAHRIKQQKVWFSHCLVDRAPKKIFERILCDFTMELQSLIDQCCNYFEDGKQGVEVVFSSIEHYFGEIKTIHLVLEDSLYFTLSKSRGRSILSKEEIQILKWK